MAFHKDFVYTITGNVVDFRKSTSTSSRSVQHAHGVEVQFTATWGELLVNVAALDINEPTRHIVIGGHADPHEPQDGVGSSRDEYNHVSLTVDLFAPDGTTPIATWQTPSGWSEEDSFTFRHVVGAATSPVGTWRCRTKNTGHKSASTVLGVVHNFDREPLRMTAAPRMMIDHAYQIILEALMPRARIEGTRIVYRFGDELIEFFGDSAGGVLGEDSIELPFGIQGTGSVQSIQIFATHGREFRDELATEWVLRKDDLEKKLATAIGQGSSGQLAAESYRRQLRENDAWRSDLEARIAPDAAAIHAKVAVSDIHLEREFDLIFGLAGPTITINVADIEEALVHVYIAFDARLLDVAAFVRTSLDIDGGVLDLVQQLGFIPHLNTVLNDLIVTAMSRAKPYVARYLGEALGKLAARDGVFMRLAADEQNWRIQHTNTPSDRRPVPAHPGDVVVADGGVIVETDMGMPGQMPPEFVIVPPAGSPIRPATYTQALDRIEHIVVVMMENRSFDHMLGYLGKPAGSRYEGVRGRHTNPLSGRAEPVALARARDVIPHPSTRVPFSPEHGIGHVERQIAKGAMSGFAQDYEDKHQGLGSYVMTYYTEQEVAVYDQLAREGGVCDHWFAAFPGGTWPNRWITLSGSTPDINNLDPHDSNIGFLAGSTIFEVLTRYDISWRVFESDLSLIRTYSRYRLDTEHVVPFYNWHDREKGFEESCKRYQLPQVSFVEPNFRDIPPLSTANDDLAPANILRGQQFIQRVVKALRDAPTWESTLLLITYDEHGGFYDHVPPPGTDMGPEEWKGRVPDVTMHPSLEHPANYMGVRVPAIIVSPWVSPGSVCKQIFDHTSIIKTILLRWRDKIPTQVFTQFGPRVNMAADLGLALTEPAPPIDSRVAIPRPEPRRADRERRVPARNPLARRVDTDDFHAALTRGFLPKRPDRRM